MKIFRTTRRVEFSETDAAGIMHFAVFFEWLEQAEHALLRALGFSVVSEFEGKLLSWPRVSAQCDFVSPVRFEDVVDIELSVARIGNSSVTYRGNFLHRGQRVAKAECITVCCKVEPGERFESVPIPSSIALALETYCVSSPN